MFYFQNSSVLKILIVSILLILTDCQYSIYSTSAYPGAIAFMTGDTNYVCFASGSIERTIYIKNTTRYSFLYTIGLNQNTYIQNQNLLMFVNPNLLIISEYKFSGSSVSSYLRTIRVYNYSREVLTKIQHITLTTPEVSGADPNIYFCGGSYKFIVASSGRATIVYRWNSVTAQYVPASITSYTNIKNPRARNITSDGKYFVQEEDSSTTVLYLYKYIAGSYTQINTYNFSPLLTANIKQVIFYKDSVGNTCFLVAIGLYNVTSLEIFRFIITATDTISIIQQVTAMSLSPDLFSISSEGNYFLAGIKSPPSLALYYYNTSTTSHSYTLQFQKTLPYSTTTVVNANFVKDDKSYFYYTSSFISSTIYSFNLYFECNVSFCLVCQFFDYCKICQSGFLLNGSTCVCPPGKNLINNVCVSCNVTLCQSCSQFNICTSCTKGYSLTNNQCFCPENKTTSVISGQCLQCNIPNCSRCDYPNICSEMDSRIPIHQQIDKLSEIVFIMMAALALIIMVMIIGFGILCMKMKSAKLNPSIQQKLPSKQQQDNNNQKIQTKAAKLQSSETKIHDQILINDDIVTQIKPTQNYGRRKNRKPKKIQLDLVNIDQNNSIQQNI